MSDPQACNRPRPAVQRLQNRAQFQAILAASVLARTPHFALHGLAHGVGASDSKPAGPPALFGSAGLWVGALTPKRQARRAVTRNTIKRQIIAVAPLFETGLERFALVVRLRAGFARSEFISATSDRLRQTVRAELLQLFETARRRLAVPASGAAPAPC